MKFIVVVAVLLSGCSTIEQAFENRVPCSLDRQQAAVISWWSAFGLGQKIAKADADIACAEKAILIRMGQGT